MYHQFEDEDGKRHGSFETFYMNRTEVAVERKRAQAEGEESRFPRVGWYWWPCFAGCLPDDDPHGPFKSEQDAIRDARSI